jgi:hypothetical protein
MPKKQRLMANTKLQKSRNALDKEFVKEGKKKKLNKTICENLQIKEDKR